MFRGVSNLARGPSVDRPLRRAFRDGRDRLLRTYGLFRERCLRWLIVSGRSHQGFPDCLRRLIAGGRSHHRFRDRCLRRLVAGGRSHHRFRGHRLRRGCAPERRFGRGDPLQSMGSHFARPGEHHLL